LENLGLTLRVIPFLLNTSTGNACENIVFGRKKYNDSTNTPTYWKFQMDGMEVQFWFCASYYTGIILKHQGGII